MSPPDPKAWGIQLLHEEGGRARRLGNDTVAALLSALRARGERPGTPNVLTVAAGEARVIPGALEVITEDGRVLPVEGDRLPADLPLGYHRLTWRDAPEAGRLIVSPGRCYLPRGLRAWGWAVQLYALRSRASWGMGDLADLDRFFAWAGELGAHMCQINTLHAVAPGAPQHASPYFPGSRLWRNPLYLAIEELEEAATAGVVLDDLATAGRALNAARRIDRDVVYRLKMSALERIWDAGVTNSALDEFVRRRGAPLEWFATFTALAERYGSDPGRWATELQRPTSPAVSRFRRAHEARVRFHMWLQLLLHRQLERAACRGMLVQDLAVGVDPNGADAWMWQDVFAREVHAGAPPDLFNPQGQDWGVSVFDPWRLRAAGYEPFIQTVRASLSAGGGIRIDHVMGLWRLYWIPLGASPSEGGYLRYPTRELLDILALESHRAGAFVIGEDLGTVEQEVPEEMTARDILGSRVLWFEQAAPAQFPRCALATVTTHDLPTIAGLWSGADVEARRAMGLDPDEAAPEALRRRLARDLRLPLDTPAAQVIPSVYRLLATAPCMLLGATLEDVLEVLERPNHPGTTSAWPNWSLALPLTLEELERDARALEIARALARP